MSFFTVKQENYDSILCGVDVTNSYVATRCACVCYCANCGRCGCSCICTGGNCNCRFRPEPDDFEKSNIALSEFFAF